MRCPHCEDATLVMSERAGIEIDYCPKCRGVWLDRGELDKIIERAAGDAAPAPAFAPPMPAQPPQQQPYPQQQQAPPQYYGKKPDDSHYGYPSPYGYQKKRKSWLSDIFD